MTGNFWLGNEKLHLLTSNRTYTVMFELKRNGDDTKYYATYSTFKIANEEEKYRITISGFSGIVFFLYHYCA